MFQNPIIGTTVKDRKVHKVRLDPSALLMGHLLAVASSGGGKSWAVRVLLEQTFGLFPHLVIDREGELKTLREKYDYIIFSADEEGDCRIDHRSGKLLARRMLELNASCIIEVYEFSAEQQAIFVRDFCKALINAPRALWGPRLVVIDEAHDFAPESGKAESKQAVCELLAKGRKRGCGVILATQRVAKLSKDAISECRTKMYGFCNLLADRKRATDDLGFISKKDQGLFRDLDTGNFYVVGPAISKREVLLIKTANVKTTHPRPGEGIQAHTPPAKASVKKFLKELSDLPAESKQEIVDLAAAKKEVTKLRAELTRKKTETVEVVDTRAVNTAYQRGRQEAGELAEIKLKALWDLIEDQERVWNDLVMPNTMELEEQVVGLVKGHSAKMKGAARLAVSHSKEKRKDIMGAKSGRWTTKKPNLSNKPRALPVEVAPVSPKNVEPVGDLNAAQQRILNGLAWWDAVGVSQPSRRQVAFAAGYTVNGHFNNTLGSLRTVEFIDYPTRGTVTLTETGNDSAQAPDNPPSTEALQALVRGKLNGAQDKLLEALLETYPEPMSRDALASAAGYTVNGHFNNTLGSLKTLGVLDYPRRGEVRACDVLFLEA